MRMTVAAVDQTKLAAPNTRGTSTVHSHKHPEPDSVRRWRIEHGMQHWPHQTYEGSLDGDE